MLLFQSLTLDGHCMVHCMVIGKIQMHFEYTKLGQFYQTNKPWCAWRLKYLQATGRRWLKI